MYNTFMAFFANRPRHHTSRCSRAGRARGIEKLAVRSIAATRSGIQCNLSLRENLIALEAAVAEEARRQTLEMKETVVGRKGPAEAIRAISDGISSLCA